MALWTDIIDPETLTGYARASMNAYEARKGTLARWLPNRPLIALLAAVVFTFMLVELDDGILMFIIGVVAAVAAIYPPRVTEVKKAFRATARAKRLLGASFVVALRRAASSTFAVATASRASTGAAPDPRTASAKRR